MPSESPVRHQRVKAPAPPFGRLLKRQRARDRLSQLDLGFRAAVSARHISFLETGRASPSRGMVHRLAIALRATPRETNALFQAAGYAPPHTEVNFADPRATDARRVIEFLLSRHEPFSAVAFDRLGNIVASNAAHRRLLSLLLPEDTPPDINHNILRLLFHPAGLRTSLVNWEDVAAAALERFRREVERFPDGGAGMLEELARFDLPEARTEPNLSDDPPLMLAMQFRHGDLDLELIATVTTLGTPIDVTLAEVRIETYFPANAASEDLLRRLAAAAPRSVETLVKWNV